MIYSPVANYHWDVWSVFTNNRRAYQASLEIHVLNLNNSSGRFSHPQIFHWAKQIRAIHSTLMYTHRYAPLNGRTLYISKHESFMANILRRERDHTTSRLKLSESVWISFEYSIRAFKSEWVKLIKSFEPGKHTIRCNSFKIIT